MISQFKSKVGALAQKFGRFGKQKTLKMKAKSALAKGKKFASQNKKAIAAGAAATGLGGVYGYSKGKKKYQDKGAIAVGAAYGLGKTSKIKGIGDIDIAPGFNAITESPSKSGKQNIVLAKSNKNYIKNIKNKKGRTVLIRRKNG